MAMAKPQMDMVWAKIAGSRLDRSPCAQILMTKDLPWAGAVAALAVILLICRMVDGAAPVQSKP